MDVGIAPLSLRELRMQPAGAVRDECHVAIVQRRAPEEIRH